MANSCAASTFQFSSVFLSVEEVESLRLLLSLDSTVMCPLRFVFVVVSELKIAAGVVLYYPRLKPPTTAVALRLGLWELVLSPAWQNSRSAFREVFARILRPKSMLRLNYLPHRADLLIPPLFWDLSAVFNTLPETGIMTALQDVMGKWAEKESGENQNKLGKFHRNFFIFVFNLLKTRDSRFIFNLLFINFHMTLSE